jgi:hypothetical protein
MGGVVGRGMGGVVGKGMGGVVGGKFVGRGMVRVNCNLPYICIQVCQDCRFEPN